jgi:hypothetical protein
VSFLLILDALLVIAVTVLPVLLHLSKSVKLAYHCYHAVMFFIFIAIITRRICTLV